MFRSIALLLLSFILASNADLNGIFVIDSCECNSPTEKCESNGPFIFDQQRSTVAIRYGAVQVGVGTLDSNRLDLYLNQNRCNGLYNGKNRLAELKCQHKDGVVCATKLRCVSGACLSDTSEVISAASKGTRIILAPLLGSLLMLIY